MNILQQFSIAFRAAPGATVIVDPDGKIVLTNSTLDKLFEYDPDELIGKPIDVLVPDDARAGHPELRDAYFHLPHSRSMGTGRDLFGVSKSGKLIPVEIGLNHVESSEGNYVVASVLDISERKKEEEKTLLAINAAASAMIMADAKGKIILTNTQACEMFGYGPDELIGDPVEALIPETLRRRHTVYRASYSSSPATRNMGQGRDLYGRRKDGSEFPLEIGLTPIDNHGEQLIMATVIDITERKRAEKEIRQKNNDLVRLNHELAQFAYSASHDLKAPLTTIDGLLSCIEEDADSGDLHAVMENASRARMMSRELATLIEQILGLAKSENLVEEVEELNVKSFITHIVERLEGLRQKHEVHVTIDAEDNSTISSQTTRLTQILENLIGNAIKYADQRKTDRYVRISVTRRDTTLHITIEDNGIGIPADDQQKVFQMFKRFGNHSESGSGLGLTLVKQNVDRLQGNISFASTSEGSRFEVELPLTSVQEEEVA